MSRQAGVGRLLLALASLLLALALAELGVRWLAPQAPAVPQGGGNRGAFSVPGDHPARSAEGAFQVHVNAQGFVDQEWGPRREERPRVLLLGDSFVQAAQVPLQDGYGRVLARRLAEQGVSAEVLSLGVPGAGTATALVLAEQWLPELAPDLVIYAMTTSNDVLNNHPGLDSKPDKPYFLLQDGRLVRVAAQDAQVPAWARGPLWAHSQLLRWVGRTLSTRAEVAANLGRGGGLPAELRVHDPAGGSLWDEAWALTDALIAALAARVDAQGASFATVLFPDAVEATTAGRARAVAQWPALADWDTGAAGQRAAALAARHGPVLPLQPALAAAEEPGAPLYLDPDGHWTLRGHRVAAEASVPFILQQLVRDRP